MEPRNLESESCLEPAASLCVIPWVPFARHNLLAHFL
jgi:hypothetical protein